MVVHPGIDPRSPRVRPTSRGRRDGWLVLAAVGMATDLERLRPDIVVTVVTDRARFLKLLRTTDPLVVVCAQPPAAREDLELVAAQRRRRPGLRAVHLAPRAAIEERLAALRLGFDDALATDTDPAELAGRVRLLESRHRSSDEVVVVGDLEIDLAAHELRRAGLGLHLRPKEFGLLAQLAAQPGRAYTRRELLDTVWGPDHPGGSRTVDVHVRWLRSKIEPDPRNPVRLVTIRGVGYRLDR
jgi:DNA-binding response OmpR family regulator